MKLSQQQMPRPIHLNYKRCQRSIAIFLVWAIKARFHEDENAMFLHYASQLYEYYKTLYRPHDQA